MHEVLCLWQQRLQSFCPPDDFFSFSFSVTAPTISNRFILWFIHFVSPQKEQKTPKWVHIMFAFFIINPCICCLALSHRYLAWSARPAELSCFFPPPFRWKASSQFVQVFFYHHFKYDFDTIFAGGRKFTSSLKQDISEGRVEGQTHRFHLDTWKCENIHNHTLASAAVGPSDRDIYFYICIYWFIYVISYIFLSWQGGSVERRFSYQNCFVTAGMPPCTAH